MKDHLPVPFRAFAFIAFLIVIAAFSALNLDNRADVSIGAHTFLAVPIYLTSLVSFTLGALLVLPFTRRRRRGVGRDVRLAASTQPAGVRRPVRGKTEAIAAPVPERHAEQTLSKPSERRRRRWALSSRRRKTDTQPQEAAPSSAHPELAPEEPVRKYRRRRPPKRDRRARDAGDGARQNAGQDESRTDEAIWSGDDAPKGDTQAGMFGFLPRLRRNR